MVKMINIKNESENGVLKITIFINPLCSKIYWKNNLYFIVMCILHRFEFIFNTFLIFLIFTKLLNQMVLKFKFSGLSK